MVNKRKQIIWGLMLIFVLSPSLLFAELYKINNGRQVEDFKLLLNSGLTHCETSTVKYILWTDDSSDLTVLNEIVQNSPFVWRQDVISDFAEQKVYKLSSENQVNKGEEKLISKQLAYIERELKGTGILLYFQQQINETIDVKNYLSLNWIQKIQKTKTDKLLSITGYSDTIAKVVRSNEFDTNIQIITNNQRNQEKTILAIPALMEEF